MLINIDIMKGEEKWLLAQELPKTYAILNDPNIFIADSGGTLSKCNAMKVKFLCDSKSRTPIMEVSHCLVCIRVLMKGGHCMATKMPLFLGK